MTKPRPSDHPYTLVFEVKTNTSDIRHVFGALYHETDLLESCSLSALQRKGKAGKCLLQKVDGSTVLTIPVSCSMEEAALLAAMIEEITAVQGRPASFKLIGIRDNASKRLEIISKARKFVQMLSERAM